MGESNSTHSKRKTLSAVIITKDEERMIANCLWTLAFADECIVVDTGSTDNTVQIASRMGARVVEVLGGSFADWRTAGKEASSGDWILYIDADERVTPKLSREILHTIQYTSNAAYALKRNNIHFGKWFEHGGWQNDVLVRLFKRAHLREWQGKVHEHAVVDGIIAELKEPLVHLTHRNIKDGLVKSYTWTDIEASLLYEANARPVGAFTLLRKFGMEFFRRLLIQKGYKDGVEGWIESFQQAINRFFVYERLWELQQKPSLDEKYMQIEKEIARLWKEEQQIKKGK